jgi:WD40 repeat protein
MSCPACGVRLPDDFPEGLCPPCLFEAGLGVEEDSASQPSAAEDSKPESMPKGSEEVTVTSPPFQVRYFGDYEILAEIAKGGMGIVYRARQINIDRPVALKMILSDRLDELAVKRFQQEAESAGNLDHPNIVPIYEVGQHEGQHFLSMKLIQGGSLKDAMPRFRKDLRNATRLMMTIAGAIHHAHQRGVLHRDLKPQNVLIDRDGQPHVTDFGLAKRVEAQREVTRAGEWAGTPEYMPPEQAAGEFKGLTTAADIYSLGAVFYCVLTGVPPFAGAVPRILQQIQWTNPRQPRSLDPRIDRDLETICLKCLEKDPNHRYPTAAAMADDLDYWLRGEPIVARPVSAVERFRKWVRRKPAIAALSAAVVLVGVLGLAGVLWQWRAAVINAKVAKDKENEAVIARQDVERQKIEVGKANNSLKEALASVRFRAYIEHINLAKRAWDEGHDQRARELLDNPAEIEFRGFEWYYLNRLCHPEKRTLAGHESWVTSVSFSPDGKRVASASDDKTVKVWNAANGQDMLTLSGHSGTVTCVSYSPDGKRIASGDWGSDVKLWDAASGRLDCTLSGHTRGVTSVAFSHDGRYIASASCDQTIKFWDATTRQEVRTLKGHAAAVNCVSFSPDGKYLASASADGTVKLWNILTGDNAITFKGYAGSITSLSFNAGGDLASSSGSKVQVWDVYKRQEQFVLNVHSGNITCVTFSPDGNRLAAASDDQTVRVWDIPSMERLRQPESLTLGGHSGTVTGVSFSPDGKRIASSHKDKTVNLWDATTHRELLMLTPSDKPINCVAFSRDGKRIASASGDDPLIKVWEVDTGRETLTLKGHARAVNSVSFSANGKWVVSASTDGTVKLWDADNGQAAITFKGHTCAVKSVSISPDGRRIASVSENGTIKLWNVDTSQEARTIELGQNLLPDCCIAFSPDGTRLAFANDIHDVKIWDTNTGQETLTLTHPPHISWTTVSLSADARRVAWPVDEYDVEVWDTNTGYKIITLKGHGGAVRSVSFSPDGKRVASVDEHGTFKLWVYPTGEEILTVRAPFTPVIFGYVPPYNFSPDGKRIAVIWMNTITLIGTSPEI